MLNQFLTREQNLKTSLVFRYENIKKYFEQKHSLVLIHIYVHDLYTYYYYYLDPGSSAINDKNKKNINLFFIEKSPV